MHPAANFTREREELEAVLASGIFNRAPNLAQVLNYVCARYFEGQGEQIKEYNIAVDALGRPSGFDQKRDSIVRVEAHRLRKRLREYYDTDGADHALEIEIPPGQYAPRFVPREGVEAGVSPPPAAVQAEISIALAVPAIVEDAPMLPPLPLAGPLANGMEVAPGVISVAHDLPAARNQSGGGSRNAVVLAVLVLMFCTGAIALWNGPIRKTARAAGSPIGGMPALASGAEEFRILAGHLGSDYTDRRGKVWQADRYFQGGYVFETPDHPILGTREPRIYQNRREGTFSYDIPLTPGVYELRLHFAETLYGENNAAGGGESSRIFHVYINGNQVLRDFDVISDAGPSTADIRAFKDISPSSDGKLHLKFVPMTNSPLLSAIEITPGTAGRLRPIRMIATDRALTDKQGRVWEPDRYSRGGQLVFRTKPVEGAEDAELFHGERYGNLRYVIPVPPGRYGVTLYFAEAWFGPGKPPGGGVGSRAFDILANGLILRRGFDVFKEAKGAERATAFSAHGLEPDAQGKLNLALVPSRNYACVNAIEVLDESK
jgi:Malectin domain